MDRSICSCEIGARSVPSLGIPWTVLLIVVLLGTNGCGKKYKASLTEIEYQRALAGKKPVSESSLIVHGEKITVDDIMEAPTPFNGPAGGPAVLGELLSPVARVNSQGRFAELARPRVEPVVDNKVSEALLYTKAKSGIPTDKFDEVIAKAKEQEWRRFVLRHEGDEAKADEALAKRGMTREQFKKLSMRSILTEVHVKAQISSRRPIRHWEMVEQYQNMKNEFFVLLPKIQFELIDIVPDKLDSGDTDSDSLEQARRLATDLVRQLRDGADFAELARAHSHGIYAKQGGQWPERSPDSFVEPYDQVIEAARSAGPGDIVGPVEAGGRVFVLKLDQRQEKGYRPLGDVEAEVESKIREDRKKVAVEKLLKEISTLAEAGETATYVDQCMNEAYRRYHEQ